MVPDKLPNSSKEPTDEMRRERALKSVRTNLVNAVRRLNAFLADADPEDIIRRVHTAKTEITNDSDDPELVTYFSLWTDFADMRLTPSGQLLRCDDLNKYSNVKRYKTDQSAIVSPYELRTETTTYKTAHLLSLANSLDRFLKPTDHSTAS